MDEGVEIPPIPEGAGFTADFLAQLKFTSGRQAVGYLRAPARQHGIDLASRDAFADGKIRLYCHRGSLGAGKTMTTKTGCEFHLTMTLHGRICAMPSAPHLEHNHPLPERRMLAVTHEELCNLRAFGDVPFLLGAAMRQTLGSTTFPVTFFNTANQIVARALFPAFEPTEDFSWLLDQCVAFLEGRVQTIFTDDGIGMLAVFEIVQHVLLQDHPDLRHRVPMWHKRTNYTTHRPVIRVSQEMLCELKGKRSEAANSHSESE
jgi:hypothetical protein